MSTRDIRLQAGLLVSMGFINISSRIPEHAKQNFSKNDILKRMEEDRERVSSLTKLVHVDSMTGTDQRFISSISGYGRTFGLGQQKSRQTRSLINCGIQLTPLNRILTIRRWQRRIIDDGQTIPGMACLMMLNLPLMFLGMTQCGSDLLSKV